MASDLSVEEDGGYRIHATHTKRCTTTSYSEEGGREMAKTERTGPKKKLPADKQVGRKRLPRIHVWRPGPGRAPLADLARVRRVPRRTP